MRSLAPTLMISKKYNAICYHGVRRACASGTIWATKTPMRTHLSDWFTKLLSGGLSEGGTLSIEAWTWQWVAEVLSSLLFGVQTLQ
jgi:hypothetical protein